MRRLITLTAAAAFFLTTLSPSRSVAADTGDEAPAQGTIYGSDSVDARFVGVSGGVILGAEAVMMVQAAFGVDKLWPYLVFPALGAAGGGVGGYFLEQESAPGAVALLITGIALVIPAAILTTSAFAYDPEKEGALRGNGGEGSGQLSFELPPDMKDSREEEPQGAVTEVEAPGEVGPPPGPGAPAESPAPEENIEDETPPEETPPSDVEPTADGRSKKSHRYVRSGSGGFLLSVSASGSPSFGIPSPSIRPALFKDVNGVVMARRGVEVMLPLLRVALP